MKWDQAGRMVIVYGNAEGPNGVSDGAVWTYTPIGDAWHDIPPERPGAGNAFGYGGVALDPLRPGVIMVSTLCRWSRGDTVFRTVDGGNTWRSLREQSVMDSASVPFLQHGKSETDFGHWIGDVEIDPHERNRAWFVTGATIYTTNELDRADRGAKIRWNPEVAGLEETAVLDLESPPTGPALLSALGDIGGFRHDDLTREGHLDEPHPELRL